MKKRPWPRGENHPHWKGDAVKNPGLTGRKRARNRYPLTPCEKCGGSGFDRHHIDGNTLNNEPENIQILCRRCHMEVDGRLAVLTTVYAGQPKTDPKPCIQCERLYKPLRKGLCSRCYDRKRRPRRA